MNLPLLHAPDPVPALRRFALWWLLLMMLLVFGPRLVPNLMPLGWISPQLYVIHAALLAGYLAIPWLQRRLGQVYLPLALVFAAFGSQAILLLYLRLEFASVQAGPITFGNIIGIAHWLLLWPTVAVVLGWKYRLLQIVLFAVALGGFNVLGAATLFHGIRSIGADGLLAFVFLSAAMITIGSFVRLLSNAEQDQRSALQTANMQLRQAADTLEQLTISRERNAMARELHDTLAHTLSSLAVQLETARAYAQEDVQVTRRLIDEALDGTRSGLHETRRALQSLRASPLDDIGLVPAIRALAHSAAQRANLALTLQLPHHPLPLAPAVEQSLYRIAQEAIGNVVRHADAKQLCVELITGPEIVLTVADDGRGFRVEGHPAPGHYGLLGMRERAALIGADLQLTSASQAGTTIQVRLKREAV
jgi:signal transduction histidine kinase